MLPGAWGGAQVGIADFVPTADDDATYWLHAIPLGAEAEPIALRVSALGAGRPGSDVVIAAVSLFHGTADPLVLSPRRQLLVEGAGGLPDVDLGIAIAARPLPAPVARRARGPVGWGGARAQDDAAATPAAGASRSVGDRSFGDRLVGDRSVVDVALAPDARLTIAGWELAAADLDAGAVSPDGRISIQPLPPAEVRVDVHLTADGQPTPARVRFVAADGRYLPPLGHREEINPGLLEDTGAGLILGGDTYAYVPGAFRIDLPVGTVDVEVVKGFDHGPVCRTLTVGPGTHELAVALDRRIDLRAEGWLSADSHVHFLSPSTALLQAAAEDVTFVHLLATQLGDEFTNVTDLTWGSQRDPAGRHFVIVGTENRQNLLGHLALLGARRPVVPLASGGGPEGRIGGAVAELLADWADRCHAEGGLVVGAHFPLPLAEIAADIVAGRIDAVEMQTFAPGLDNPSILEWYRFLDCGYRVPVLGGTDKMSAEMPLGAIRTYARLDPGAPPTFDGWAAAVRAGRTFATSGPVIELSVDGHEPGDVLALPASGGHLEARVRARAAQPVIGTLELVMNGRVVARQDAPNGGSDDLGLSARIEVRAGAWIAARARSEHEIRSAYNTSMAGHTSPVYVEVADRPLFAAEEASAIVAVIDGTVRWLETMAAIDDPAVRARMAARIAESANALRERIAQTTRESP
jgi:hypothetical protein